MDPLTVAEKSPGHSFFPVKGRHEADQGGERKAAGVTGPGKNQVGHFQRILDMSQDTGRLFRFLRKDGGPVFMTPILRRAEGGARTQPVIRAGS